MAPSGRGSPGAATQRTRVRVVAPHSPHARHRFRRLGPGRPVAEFGPAPGVLRRPAVRGAHHTRPAQPLTHSSGAGASSRVKRAAILGAIREEPGAAKALRGVGKNMKAVESTRAAAACVACGAEVHAARCSHCGAAVTVRDYRVERMLSEQPHSRMAPSPWWGVTRLNTTSCEPFVASAGFSTDTPKGKPSVGQAESFSVASDTKSCTSRSDTFSIRRMPRLVYWSTCDWRILDVATLLNASPSRTRLNWSPLNCFKWPAFRPTAWPPWRDRSRPRGARTRWRPPTSRQ